MVKQQSRSPIDKKILCFFCIVSILSVAIIWFAKYTYMSSNIYIGLNFFQNKTLFRRTCATSRFSTVNLPATGLVSFPGSGNTWLRYLVQEASGILTGSEYEDHDLLQDHFPAEGVTNASTILVKTHGSDAKTREMYSRVILLIRHPEDAILADFNRYFGRGHQSFASHRDFQENWRVFSKVHAKAWHSFHTAWRKYEKPLLIVLYDDLVSKPVTQLKKIFGFLKIQVTPTRMECAIYNGEQFKRPHSGSQPPVTLYSSQMMKYLDQIYNVTLDVFRNKLKHQRQVQ